MDHQIVIPLYPEHWIDGDTPMKSAPKYDTLQKYIERHGAQKGTQRYLQNARNDSHPEWAL